MPVTKEETNVAQEVIQILTGNQGEAEAYAEAPQAWLESHGYNELNPEAVAQCGAGYGGGSGGSGGGGGGYAGPPPPVSAGVEAQLDYIVYNNYFEDNSITNNIENHGTLDFDQQVVTGDENIVVGENADVNQAQTGDGSVQIDDSILDDSNIEAGEGDQLVDESVNTATNVGDGQAQAGVGGDATQIEVEEAPPEEPVEDEADPV
jgi:hypothetical protein